MVIFFLIAIYNAFLFVKRPHHYAMTTIQRCPDISTGTIFHWYNKTDFPVYVSYLRAYAVGDLYGEAAVQPDAEEGNTIIHTTIVPPHEYAAARYMNHLTNSSAPQSLSAQHHTILVTCYQDRVPGATQEPTKTVTWQANQDPSRGRFLANTLQYDPCRCLFTHPPTQTTMHGLTIHYTHTDSGVACVVTERDIPKHVSALEPVDWSFMAITMGLALIAGVVFVLTSLLRKRFIVNVHVHSTDNARGNYLSDSKSTTLQV